MDAVLDNSWCNSVHFRSRAELFQRPAADETTPSPPSPPNAERAAAEGRMSLWFSLVTHTLPRHRTTPHRETPSPLQNYFDGFADRYQTTLLPRNPHRAQRKNLPKFSIYFPRRKKHAPCHTYLPSKKRTESAHARPTSLQHPWRKEGGAGRLCDFRWRPGRKGCQLWVNLATYRKLTCFS